MIKINEIFTSIDGEVNKWGQGAPTTFIRLQGCNLRCSYCDTPYALENNSPLAEIKNVKEVVNQVLYLRCPKVTITGGEPLNQQPAIWELIDSLSCLGCQISIETNGSYRIMQNYLNRDNICWIVDYKYEYGENMIVEYTTLGETDWVKFIVNEENVKNIFDKIKQMRKEGVRARIAVSGDACIFDGVAWLAKLLISEKMFDVNLNVQLHKLIRVK